MRKEAFLSAKKNWSKQTNLHAFLGKDWIDSVESISDERVPVLAWMLSGRGPPSTTIISRLDACIGQIKSIGFSSEQLSKVMAELQSRDEETFIGMFSELDCMAYFTERNFKVKYEPDIRGLEKLPDFAVNIDGRDVIFEVSSLQQSAPNSKRERIRHEIQKQIVKLPSQLSIFLSIKSDIEPNDIKPAVGFLKRLIKANKETELIEPIKGIQKARIRKLKHKTNFTHLSTGWSWVGDANKRLRQLIKRESKQLSKSTPNIIAVNLFNYARQKDFYNAFLGDEQYTMLIEKNTGRIVQEGWTRNHKDKLFTPTKNRRITAAIGYKYIFTPKNVILHNNPYLEFTEKELSILAPVHKKQEDSPQSPK